MEYLKTLKGLLLTLLLVCVGNVSAHDFEVDGIYYKITNTYFRTVAVTYSGSYYGAVENEYSGNVIIPESIIYNSVNYSVTSIGDYAFYGCSGLTNITIPNSVTSIGEDAFYGTAWYNNQSDGVVYAGNVLYKYKGIMPENTSITIKEGTLGITCKAFSGQSNLIDIDIPNSVIIIGEDAFSATGWYYNQPSGPLYLNDWLVGCKGNSIGDFKIKDGIKKIARRALYNKEIKNITIPNSIVRINKDAFGPFRNDQGAVYISDLESWCNIEFEMYSANPLEYLCNLFLNGEKLSNLVIPNNVKEIKSFAFSRCWSLESIEISSSVRTIGAEAFYACHNVKSLIINNGVEEIGISAFSGGQPNISMLEIPKSVICIKKSAFGGFMKLENIYFNSNPILETDAIPSTANCHLILDDSNRVDFNTTNSNTYSDVSYTRTIDEGKYATIVLPFTPDATSLENYAFYALAESGDGYMRFEEVATPVANTPYIYTLREGKENVAITGGETTISSTVETPVVDGWQTIGSFTNQALDTSDGNYYAFSPSKNEINKITKNLTVLPYRAYFKSDNASKSALSIYISGTTGVEEISSSEIDGFENGAIFDLSGRKVAEPRKGNVYIKNGKKIMF